MEEDSLGEGSSGRGEAPSLAWLPRYCPVHGRPAVEVAAQLSWPDMPWGGSLWKRGIASTGLQGQWVAIH